MLKLLHLLLCIKRSLYALQTHIEFSVLVELGVHIVKVVFLQRVQEFDWNNNFCRETIWFVDLKDYVQTSIDLFPDVFPQTNCLIFLERGNYNDGPQMCGGCSGYSNGNRLYGHMSAELVWVSYTINAHIVRSG